MTPITTPTTARQVEDRAGQGAAEAAEPKSPTPRGRRHTALKDRLSWAVSDTLAVTQRNLIAYTRIPEMLVFSSICARRLTRLVTS